MTWPDIWIYVVWGIFAAIRLTVLDEHESEEEVIFNQRPLPPRAGWTLDPEDTNPERKQHQPGSQRKSKVSGNAQRDAAFSSPLVRWSLSQQEDPDDLIQSGMQSWLCLSRY